MGRHHLISNHELVSHLLNTKICSLMATLQLSRSKKFDWTMILCCVGPAQNTVTAVASRWLRSSALDVLRCDLTRRGLQKLSHPSR
jgi:hypothetical protein